MISPRHAAVRPLKRSALRDYFCQPPSILIQTEMRMKNEPDRIFIPAFPSLESQKRLNGETPRRDTYFIIIYNRSAIY
jgi:hypothetical protein